MSREIKYRVITETRIYYWGFINGEFRSPPFGNGHSMEEIKKLSSVYTGLNDRTGKPIYEGDIVEYKDYSGGVYLYGKQPMSRDVVKWNKDTGGYKVRGMGYTFSADKYEVIGNIYESPELLGGNKE